MSSSIMLIVRGCIWDPSIIYGGLYSLVYMHVVLITYLYVDVLHSDTWTRGSVLILIKISKIKLWDVMIDTSWLH